MRGLRFAKPVRAVDHIKFLTVQEQEKFMDTAKRSHNHYQYALLLETGLRTGELIGPPWDANDWKKRTLTVIKRWNTGTRRSASGRGPLRRSRVTARCR